MSNATLAQGNQLFRLILAEDDPRTFTQDLIEKWGFVRKVLRTGLSQGELIGVLSSQINLHASEREEVRGFYPEGWAPKSWEVQLYLLQNLWGEGYDYRYIENLATSWAGKLPVEADGLYVVPKILAVSRALGTEDPFGSGYTAMVEEAWKKVSSNREVGDVPIERGCSDWRLTESASSYLSKLELETPGDFLVFPAQTGQLYAGYSMRNARWEIEHSLSQVGMYTFAMANILLTHPGRLSALAHLPIGCIGDECKNGEYANYTRVPVFGFSEVGKYLYLGMTSSDSYSAGAGSLFMD